MMDIIGPAVCGFILVAFLYGLVVGVYRLVRDIDDPTQWQGCCVIIGMALGLVGGALFLGTCIVSTIGVFTR